ncbi:MAG TPA: alpha-amylase family glycosyl hydrolase, partial [Adhaeribacter sp.]|nr:alpha-amylase family glycosyl hydrolase [Adhaeribacter sp.]
MVFTPSATYRIQFHKDFKFRDLQPLIPYLAGLGINTIYASPIYKARAGSTHGYDVTDAARLNPEIGTMAEFEELQQTLKTHNMSWLQDIVPNHMAFHPDNVWLMDVFEKGPLSRYYNSFDINWNHPDPTYTSKVMAPFLGAPLAEVLETGDVKITLTDAGFFVQFYENLYPVSLQTWPELLAYISEKQALKKEDSEPIFLKVKPFAATEILAADLKNWDETKASVLKLIAEKSGL